jgi:transcriptional regulator with XRE-family HTH domain
MEIGQKLKKYSTLDASLTERRDQMVTPIVPNTLGDRVRQERRMRGITQGELAASCGCSTSVISNVETSRKSTDAIAVELMNALAAALGTTADYLHNGIKPPKPFEARGPIEIKILELIRRVPEVAHPTMLAVLRDFGKLAMTTATKGG